MSELVEAEGMARLLPVVQELSLARTIEDVQRTVRTAARALTNADGATFVLRDGDDCFYADEDAIEPLWKGRRFPMSSCISGWVMLHKTSTVISDIYKDDRIPADAYRPTFVKSLAMVPIRTAAPIGAIGNYWASEREPTAVELKLLQALADSASIAIQNVSLLAELQASLAQRTEAEVALRRELDERTRAEAALRRTEHQLRQAQKMEAIGQLAGGVAHDFNNVLSVILSFASLALAELRDGDPLKADMLEIEKAGLRAATLTRQLLAFSRHQVLEPRVVDLNRVVVDMERMLKRLIGDDVELESRLAAAIDPVFADAGQLGQVLLNLVVNARDAMPTGGKLTLETQNVTLNGEYTASHMGVRPGAYVMLAVSDTGIGMDKETQARIFDPFFTTKEKGKGTGLGLSTAYGIVSQSAGHIWVYSEPGRGTTFKVYLPKHADAAAGAAAAPAQIDPATLTGTETILLVEDDDQVRAVTRAILEKARYRVLETKNGGEALLVCERHGQPIHLLLTDVVMAQMSGVELARRLARDRPEMKVICMSGYTDEAVFRHGVVDSSLAFLQKPITPEALLSRVRQVLGPAAPPA